MSTIQNLPQSDLDAAHRVLDTLREHLRLEIRVQANHGDTFACDEMHAIVQSIDEAQQSLIDETTYRADPYLDAAASDADLYDQQF